MNRRTPIATALLALCTTPAATLAQQAPAPSAATTQATPAAIKRVPYNRMAYPLPEL